MIKATGGGTTRTAPGRMPEIVRAADVQRMLGGSRRQANRLLQRLEAAGLRRKGVGRAICWDADQFRRLWDELDDRK